jgi:glycosyltransferase involved in cell wall biosynthesis
MQNWPKLDSYMRTTLLVLTLNEIEGMRIIMPKINRKWVDQIIVVDGGSTDGTVEYAYQNHYEVHQQTKKGIRYGYLEVLPKIIGDVVITFSPDGNSPPEAIPKLISKMQEGYDLVIGSRYFADAKSEDDDVITAFGNWLFTRTINWLHRAKYTDAMVMYRAFKKDIIYQLQLEQEKAYSLPEKLFRTIISWEPLMCVRAAKSKLKTADIAVDEPRRIGGKRKLQILRWGCAYYFQFFYEKFT